MRRQLAFAAGVAVILVACTKAASWSPTDGTGIRGVAVAGPTCPVVTDPPDPSCDDRPVSGAVIVLEDLEGREMTRTVSDADGTFWLPAPAGTYWVVAQPVDGLMGTPEPVRAIAEDGGPAVLTLAFDTGIR